MPDGLPDVIGTDLAVLFCGINPGLQAAATGHHFAGRGNRFWRAIHVAGFTPEELTPENDRTFLRYGCGLTTVVERPAAAASLLTSSDFQTASDQFSRKILLQPDRTIWCRVGLATEPDGEEQSLDPAQSERAQSRVFVRSLGRSVSRIACCSFQLS